MTTLLQPLYAPPLRPASTPEAYAIHKAALEWSLAEPIIINSAEDIKSRASWRGRFEPYEHQVRNLMTFCRRLPVTLLADDVGLGKTISAGLILSELMARKRALVVCPKILLPQWQEELQTKFGIDALYSSGAEIIHHLSRPSGVVITTYDSARRYFDEISRASFEMLILDEAHKLRNLHGTDKPPQIAERIREALAKRTFKYVLMLTATPLQNRLWDLYSLVDLLTVAKGHRNPLGEPDEFRDRFIADRQTGRRLVQGRAEEFRSILRNYMSRVRRGEAKLLFPERQVRLHRVRPTPGEMEIYKVIAGPIQKLNHLAQISLAQALMSSPHALVAQMENMVTNGTLPQEVLMKVRELAGGLDSTAKLNGLETLIDELRKKGPRDWRLVIFTSRRDTQRAIGDFLGQKGIAYGFIRGAQAVANRRTITDLWADPPKINVVVSMDVGAEGVNLQVANVLMNFDLPWNPMIVEQRIGRIQRLASKHANVVVVNTILAGTVEERVVARLMEKLQLAAHAVGDIEALLEGAGMEGTEDDSDSFENEIRELVIKSLAGQDVEKATQMTEESIARAKALIAEAEEALNSTLGRMDGAYKQGPRMPDLVRTAPSMKADDFVIGAFKAEGGEVTLRDGGVHEVSFPGRPREKFTFDERLAEIQETGPDGRPPLIGQTPRLYRPGQPAFERLVQSWTEKCGHYMSDLSSADSGLLEEVLKTWCESIPRALYQSHRVEERKMCFQGSIVMRVQATIAHDSFEKLIEVDVRPQEHEEVAPKGGQVRQDEIAPADVNIKLDPVLPKVLEDRDVGLFCRFYHERRDEELIAAGSDERRRTKVSDDFTPKVFPALAGMRGVAYDLAAVRVSYTIDEQGPYESALSVLPASRQFLWQPKRAQCAATGIAVPEGCLAKCVVTGKRVLRHLLFRSESSGRLALKELAKICALTGKKLLPDEVGISSVTGSEVGLDLLRKSPISGRLAEPSEFAACEFTGTEVLRDERAQSEVSGKHFRRDQLVRSAVSGRSGHQSEFLTCVVTGKPLLHDEAEFCELTGKPVIPGSLVVCHVTRKRALPSEMGKSAVSGHFAIWSEMLRCSVTGQPLLREEAVFSEMNGKPALPGALVTCAITGKKVLPAETGKSELSGRIAIKSELRKCAVTGKTILSDEAATCDLTGRPACADLLVTCAVTGKKVLPAETGKSELSSRIAIKSELRKCAVTGKTVLSDEAEFCELTRRPVVAGLLVTCSVTGKKVLPSEVGRSEASGRTALKGLLVASSISGQLMIRDEAVRSVDGRICLPGEARACAWTSRLVFPDDIAVCALTGIPFSRGLLTNSQRIPPQLKPLRDLLDGKCPSVQEQELWPRIAIVASVIVGRCDVVSAVAAPDGMHLAVCAKISSWLGLRTRYTGFLFKKGEPGKIQGALVVGRREAQYWVMERALVGSAKS